MSLNWVKIKAKIVYSPKRPGLKKHRKEDDFWLIAEIKGDIAKYYSWWVKKKLYLTLQLPAWRPHVTILDGRYSIPDDKLHLWKMHDGEIIELEYNVNIEQHWKFFVLPVRCERLQEMRRELGFYDKRSLHITIGRML